MATSQKVQTWSELKRVLENGESVESALGLKEEDRDPPSPRTLEDNLTVSGVIGQDETFRYKLPDPNEIKVLGLTEVYESLPVLPPFLDLSKLLQPMYIPEPNTSSPMSRHPGELVLNLPTEHSETVPKTRGVDDDDSPMDVSEQAPILGNALRKSTKRKRKQFFSPEKSSGRHLPVNKKTKDQSSSPELLELIEPCGDDDVVDLTQD